MILFVYKLIIGSSKNSTENCTRKCFCTQEKETWVNFNPGLSANRPSNNSAQFGPVQTSIVSCTELYTYLGRPKRYKFDG